MQLIPRLASENPVACSIHWADTPKEIATMANKESKIFFII
jgi:hypothetical protein